MAKSVSLALYKQMLRESYRFQNYNFRLFASLIMYLLTTSLQVDFMCDRLASKGRLLCDDHLYEPLRNQLL